MKLWPTSEYLARAALVDDQVIAGGNESVVGAGAGEMCSDGVDGASDFGPRP